MMEAYLPRFKRHWWVIVTPEDGDCYRQLIDSEDAARIMLPAIQSRYPEARIMRVRLMSAVRPPGQTGMKKPKPVAMWRLGRPVRPKQMAGGES